MPFVYKKQNVILLNDIRNFVFDYQLITDYYLYDLNEFCLLVDLILFCNNGVSLVEKVDDSLYDILDRNILFRNFSFHEKDEYVNQQFYLNIGSQTQRKNKFLLCLMNQWERTRFINEFLIVDFE
jgi:hypothetical protein